jgi:hypothetical protein
MKRLALLLVLVAGVVLMFPGSGSCTYIADNDFLNPSDVIGNNIFQIRGWDIQVGSEIGPGADPTDVTINIDTNYTGAYTIDKTVGGTNWQWHTFVGDLFIDVGTGYNLGIAFSNKNGLTPGHLYSGISSLTSDYHNPDVNPNKTTYRWYSEGYFDYAYRAGEIVTIGAGTDLGAVGFNHPAGSATWFVSLDVADLPGYSGNVEFRWASATCANDIIVDSIGFTAVPEPATVFLVGCGLVGWFGWIRQAKENFRRKKRVR